MAEPRTRRGVTATTGASPTARAIAASASPPLRRRAAAITSGLLRVTYTDDDGRRWAVLVPPGHEDEAALGIVLGPPDLSELGLSVAAHTRLHNELFDRGLITAEDVRGKAHLVFGAIQAAYKADTAAVIRLYQQQGQEGG